MTTSENSIFDDTRAYFQNLPLFNDVRHPVRNYNSFINYFHKLAIEFSENVCAYYQDINSTGETVVKSLTYEQVDRISSNLACTLYPFLKGDSVVSLFESHSVYYYILSLAIYKLRIPVLLLSTRNSSQSASHLLKQTGAQTLIYGKFYTQIKDDIIKMLPIKSLEVPDINIDKMIQAPLNPDSDVIFDRNFTSEDLEKTLLIVHSSGTTGPPKAVYWGNQYLMYYAQILPRGLIKMNCAALVDNDSDISINLAPLYHSMGLFSHFYSMVQGASVFFFHQFPPSADEVFKVIKSMNITRLTLPPSYVTLMIHIMQKKGDIQPFKKMKIICSSGAPTPKATDEFLLKHDINFISLHGMSECVGFMGSEVSLNKVDSNTFFFTEGSQDHAYMEQFDKDRYQLIVKSGSFFLATGVSNRPNGDFATKDLFLKSKVKENGYIYVGRADDILIMSSGEKTNPIPIEDMIKVNPVVSHCIVVGQGRPFPGALVELNFEVAKKLSLDYILKSVQETIRKANIDAPRHSVILPDMVKIIPFDKKLPISDKGTVIRKLATGQFEEDINEMYVNFLSQNKEIQENHSNIDVRSKILEIVNRVMGSSAAIKDDVSLFKQGLNSVSVIQLSNYISEDLFKVSQTFLYEHQAITNIINALERNIASKSNPISTDLQFDYGNTTKILNKYLKRASEELATQTSTYNLSFGSEKAQVVLLTGATGSLGAYILLKLLENVKVKKVYVLVRSKEGTDLIGRIADTFQKQNYPVSKLFQNKRVEAIPMRLDEEGLGLSADYYEKLKSEVTMIQACGWLLDFNQPVSYFDTECINGIYNLIKFANKSKNSISFHFISSVSASSVKGDEIIREVAMPSDPKIAAPMGYAQSKFIVEQLLNYLVEQKRMPCFIYRVGQLCGNRINGSWNTDEMYPLTLIGGGNYMKKLPNLNMVIDWLPLDIAGDSIVKIMMKTVNILTTTNDYIFHIVNPNEVSWSSFLVSLKKCGMNFEVVDPELWVKELALQQHNPAYRLVNFYKKAFKNESKSICKWEISNTNMLAPEINDAPTVNTLLPKYLDFWKRNGFY